MPLCSLQLSLKTQRSHPLERPLAVERLYPGTAFRSVSLKLSSISVNVTRYGI